MFTWGSLTFSFFTKSIIFVDNSLCFSEKIFNNFDLLNSLKQSLSFKSSILIPLNISKVKYFFLLSKFSSELINSNKSFPFNCPPSTNLLILVIMNEFHSSLWSSLLIFLIIKYNKSFVICNSLKFFGIKWMIVSNPLSTSEINRDPNKPAVSSILKTNGSSKSILLMNFLIISLFEFIISNNNK